MKNNCKLQSNSKPKFTRHRVAAALCTSALLGLTTLSTQRAQAACDPTLQSGGAASIGFINTANGQGPGGFARVGDQITITRVTASRASFNLFVADGPFGNTGAWFAKPDGLGGQVVQKSHGTFQFTSFGTENSASCNGTAGSLNAPCLTFNTSYTVSDADVGRPLSLGSATVLPATFAAQGAHMFPGIAGAVQFAVAAEGTHFQCDDLTVAAGLFKPASGVFIKVFHPGIQITKECVTTCPPGSTGNSRFGQPIQFTGLICNTGDVALAGIQVTDDPATPNPIVISNMTTAGQPFNGVLQPNQCVRYSGSYPVSGCGPFTDRVTVTAVPQNVGGDIRPVTASATATCTVCTFPNISVVKVCLTPVVQAGQPISYRYCVTNNGEVPLQNVVAVDDSATPLNPADDITTSIGNLGIGEGRCVEGTVQTSVADCLAGRTFYTNKVVVTGVNICPPPQQQQVMAMATCVAQVECPCDFQIQKSVACFEPPFPPGTCGGFAKSATGVKSDTQCPAFCYRFCITNTGSVRLTPGVNLSVNDDQLGDLTGRFSPLNPGDFQCVTISPVEHCTDSRNIMTVVCTNRFRNPDGTTNTTTTVRRDTNNVVILNINITCESTLFSSMDVLGSACGGMANNSTNDCILVLPDGFAGPVYYTLKLCNTGSSSLDVTTLTGLPPGLSLADLRICANGSPVALPFSIGPNSCVELCGTLNIVTWICDTNLNFNVQAHAEASDTINGMHLCVYTRTGERVADDTNPNDCQCKICCKPTAEIECRTTGGGNLVPGFVDQSCIAVATTIFPSANVDHISHGGQLGAPFSQRDCGAVLGNPCIRGQWQHTRHYKGSGNPRDVIDMDFHSTTPKGVYDSLFCACLGCCDPVTGVFIPPTVGPLIHKFQLCNPDDHKMCGPEPRPAPANAIIFSGVGKITPTDDISGPRASRTEWVVFRVYIEDRSEPGGGHPDPSFPTEPADIYCFQAWKTGIKTSRKPDFTTISTAFRMALGQANCDFVCALESGALPIGSLPSPTVNGVTADIQDCGPLHDGNRQIHPATGADCKEQLPSPPNPCNR